MRGGALLSDAGSLSALIHGSSTSKTGASTTDRPIAPRRQAGAVRPACPYIPPAVWGLGAPILRVQRALRFELGKGASSGVAFTFFVLQYVIVFQWLIKACSVAKYRCRNSRASSRSRHPPRAVSLKARWQSGHAAACKAVYAGSIPTLASNKNNKIAAFSFPGTLRKSTDKPLKYSNDTPFGVSISA